MLPEEAQWLGNEILSRPAGRVFPLLDVASSGERFRKVEQPWIQERIFGPIGAAGGKVVHTDMIDEPGIDLVGDLYDAQFFETLRGHGFNSLLCANLLEHVPDPAAIANRLLELLDPGGILFVTVPKRYPYHAGPIDMLLRPTAGELHALFPGTRLVKGEEVFSGTWWDYLGRSPLALGKKIARLGLPLYRPKGWLTVAAHMPWLWRKFSATCVILEKTG